MKILNISLKCTFTPGLGYQENLLPEYQKKLGHEVTLITTNQIRDMNGNVLFLKPGEQILDNGVRIIRIKVNKLLAKFGYYPQIGKLIKNNQPDYIFCHNLCTLIPAQAIKYKKQHPNVILVSDNHQDISNGGKSGFFNSFIYIYYKLFWKIWIKYFYKIYATTGWRKDYANEKYGIPNEKLDTLLLGIDTDKMPKDKSAIRIKVRQELGIPKTSFVFFQGGKLYKERKVLETLKSFLVLNNENLHLILIGKLFDDIKDDAIKLIEKSKNIHYLGFINGTEVKNYLIASDFGIFPNLHSVIWEEAIGCGLPCVFGKYKGENHMNICDNCILIDNPTEENIKSILLKVSSDKDYYEKLKINAEKASDSLSYYNIAQKSLEGLK